jgi:hypothetical protein
MKLQELSADPEGKFSASKFWTNVAFTVATILVLKLGWEDSSQFGEIFLWYLVIVSGSELGKKFMTMKLSK